LELFDSDLIKKLQIVVANKIDIPQARDNARVLAEQLPAHFGPVVSISAATGEGVRALVQKIGVSLEATRRSYQEEAGESARA
jgi:GTP-binding protein